MSRLSKLLDSSPRKGFSEKPFWAHQALNGGSLVGDHENIEGNFEGYVHGAYKGNGIVFACILARLLPFSEARFQYQALTGGRPGDLFGNPSLSVLENPWPNGTTGELLAHMEQDASIAGNFYATPVRVGDTVRLRRLRPDWVTIVSGVRGDLNAGPFDIESEVLFYIYKPKGVDYEPVTLLPEQVVHYSPIPDPVAQWRGMSWLTPIIREIKADTQATKHKLKFFENGATSNFVVSYDSSVSASQFQEFVTLFEQDHKGVDNAYKTIHLGGGADATVVGADLKQIDFKATQGAGETRIAAAAGVGSIIGRLSEGMQGSSLNQGNYNAAKRQFADMTLRPLWRSAAASLAKVVDVPAGARLWYDDRDIAFLKEDQKDAADILSLGASTVARLADSGFDPDSAIAAVAAGDLSLLRGKHTGLFSVQLQTPGANGAPPAGDTE